MIVMEHQSCQKGNVWKLSDTKLVKITLASLRIIFRRKLPSGHRSIGLSMEAFSNIKDISNLPQSLISLDKNTNLYNNCGRNIHLVRYCNSRDREKCIGGIFIFTMDEWLLFWSLSAEITQCLET